MKNYRFIRLIVGILVTSMCLTSCKLFPTQKMIDNIIPDHNRRMYTIADFIPYDYKEIKNARALYGMELQEFFTKNTTTESELSRTTEAEKYGFYKELMYMTHNYKVIKNRYNMYFDEDGAESEYNKGLCEKEYKDYYDLKNADSISTIKKYNDGKAFGMPLMSIRAILSTATVSDATDFYSEVMCEIYKPVTIDAKKYNSLKFGDTVTLDIPSTSSTAFCKKTHKLNLTYVATDSLMYENEQTGDKTYLFIADIDGTNDVHRVLDYYGKTLETYVETRPLQFMKACRVSEANDTFRLLNSVINENLQEYRFGDIAEKALCGGYLTYKYKDYVYANSVTTNLKGYITAMTEYTNQRIDNEYYKTLNQ